MRSKTFGPTIFALLLALGLGAKPVHACDCAWPSTSEDYLAATIVFVGEVKKIEAVPGNAYVEMCGGKSQVIQARPTETLKGLPSSLQRVQPMFCTDCGKRFQVGRSYLFLVRETELAACSSIAGMPTRAEKFKSTEAERQMILEGATVRLEPLALSHAEALILAAADGELWTSRTPLWPAVRKGLEERLDPLPGPLPREREQLPPD